MQCCFIVNFAHIFFFIFYFFANGCAYASLPCPPGVCACTSDAQFDFIWVWHCFFFFFFSFSETTQYFLFFITQTKLKLWRGKSRFAEMPPKGNACEPTANTTTSPSLLPTASSLLLPLQMPRPLVLLFSLSSIGLLNPATHMPQINVLCVCVWLAFQRQKICKEVLRAAIPFSFHEILVPQPYDGINLGEININYKNSGNTKYN